MNAYAETYVSGAQARLGSMLDFAVNGLGETMPAFYGRFLGSPVSARFAAGDPAVVAGRSGSELVFEVLGSGTDGANDASIANGASGESGSRHPALASFPAGDFTNFPVSHLADTWTRTDGVSPEYWCGWALAFYQWASGYSFTAIEERVSIGSVRSLYTPYHEMDIRQFCDHMDELARQAHPQTSLQARRQAAGLSQRQLAQASGIPIRTLQQYEQRQKNINHARADYLEALARTLGCQSPDLFERTARSSYEYAVVRL